MTFEIASDVEHHKPFPQSAQKTQPAMVTGFVSSTGSQPVTLPSIRQPVMEQNLTSSPRHKSASGSSLPPLVSTANGPSAVPSTMRMSAASASPQRRLRKQSPQAPLPLIPQTRQVTQSPGRSPLEQVPAAANRHLPLLSGKPAAIKLPAKANTLPQLDVRCPSCGKNYVICQKENRRNSV